MMSLDLIFNTMLILSLLALFSGSAALHKDWAHPAPLLALLWLIVSAAYLLMPHPLRPLSIETQLLVMAAVTAFCAGAGLTVLLPSRSASCPPRLSWSTTRLRPLLFWVALLGLPFFLLKASALAEAANYTESFYINLRIALTGELDDAQTFGLLAYLIPVSFASALVELAASRRRWYEGHGWISLALAATYAVMATGRTYVFLLLIALAFVALIQRRATLSRVALLAAGAFAAAFFGLGALANKIGVDTPNVYALAASDALAMYLLGSLAAFDFVMEQSPALEFGANVFRSPLALLSALGLDVKVPPLVKAYVYVPEPTNVYTVFLPYFMDFGWIGVMVAFAALGGGHAWLYRWAKTSQNPRGVVLAALSMYPLLMQFFQDQYFSLLTTWITFALLLLPCFAQTSPGASTHPSSADRLT